MPFFAAPPDFSFTSRQTLFRPKVSVSRRMPFGGKFGMHRCEISLTGPGQTPGTVVTTVAGAAVHQRCFPLMAFFTAPPDFLFASAADIVRRQGRVFLIVPFLENLGHIHA